MKRLLICLLCWVAPAAAGEPAMYLYETYEGHALGAEPGIPVLRRVNQVTVADGGGRVGEGKVAHYQDDTDDGGALEYNVGTAGLPGMYVTFDLLNNRPDDQRPKALLIFGVGPWNTSSSLMLNANAKRAFSLEFSQAGFTKTLALRVGASAVSRDGYALTAPQQVEIWVNDQDERTLTYLQPDTGEEASLNPDSFVVWVNGRLVGEEPAFGYPMQTSVTQGEVGLGRVGFSSSSSGRADFFIDNLVVADPTGEAVPVAPGQVLPSVTGEVTPDRLPGAETIQYRQGPTAMNLFVFKPAGWAASDRRAAFVYFFGGGWTRGTPEKSEGWARWAAERGMVGIAPDYRTKNRFGTSPLASVADGRAAFRWVTDHADELGIDPERVAVGGSSAGGHVAAWTAIQRTPPGSDPAEAPQVKPAVLFLTSAVTDTSDDTGYTPDRFGEHARALSPVHQLDKEMPPVLMFHAADDDLVHYRSAVAFHDALVASGNTCDLVTVPEGGHGYSSAFPEWRTKVREKLESLLATIGVSP
jgi:acetyl esterase/lipase